MLMGLASLALAGEMTVSNRLGRPQVKGSGTSSTSKTYPDEQASSADPHFCREKARSGTTPACSKDAVMAMNCIQFQPGLSLSRVGEQFDTEALCETEFERELLARRGR